MFRLAPACCGVTLLRGGGSAGSMRRAVVVPELMHASFFVASSSQPMRSASFGCIVGESSAISSRLYSTVPAVSLNTSSSSTKELGSNTHQHATVSSSKEEDSPASSRTERLTLASITSLPLLATMGTPLVALAGGAAVPAIPTALAQFLSVSPPAFFFFLQISGLKTIRQIQKDKTTGQLSCLPFVSLATNCVVWTTYGILTQDLTVFAPNASGLLFGLYYTHQFMKYTTSPITKELSVGLAISAATLAAAAFLPTATAVHGIGLTGCAMAVFLMSSPLATLGTVLREKNTASMPFLTSVATFFNALTWTGYGYLVAQDTMIWAPNVMGFTAATAQLILFAIYPSSPKKDE